MRGNTNIDSLVHISTVSTTTTTIYICIRRLVENDLECGQQLRSVDLPAVRVESAAPSSVPVRVPMRDLQFV